MKIMRTIPPAAAPLGLSDLMHGVFGMSASQKYLGRLKHSLSEYFEVKYVYPVSSGKAALTLILLSLKSLYPGKNNVVIPAYTCYSVPSAIVKAGLSVSLCDIDHDTFDFDYHLLEKSIDKKTLCVVAGHLFGIPSDMDTLTRLVRSRGAIVVEDAAQAMGGNYKGKMLGTIGDVGFFSLGRGKNITCGEGGLITTNSDEIARAIDSELSRCEDPSFTETLLSLFKMVLMAIFIHPTLYWFPLGLPFLRLGETVFYQDFPMQRLSGMQAGLLARWKKNLEDSNRARRENTNYYSKELQQGSGSIPSLSCLRYPLMVKDNALREEIHARSVSHGMGISRMYPAPVHEIAEIRDRFAFRKYPKAKELAERILTFPTHHLLTEKDRQKICRFFTGSEKEQEVIHHAHYSQSKF